MEAFVEEALRLGLDCQHQGDLAGAAAEYAKLLEVVPGQREALYLSGVVAYRAQKFQSAVEYFEAAQKAWPEKLEIAVDLGNALASLNQPEAARTAYRTALEVDPRSAYNLGLFELENGDRAAADRYFASALVVDPTFEAARIRRAELMVQEKRWAEADEMLAALGPDSSSELWVLRGEVDLEKGHTQAAAHAFVHAAQQRRGGFGVASQNTLRTTPAKILHDAAQFHYLKTQNVSVVSEEVLAFYSDLARICMRSEEATCEVQGEVAGVLSQTHHRFLHYDPPARRAGSVLNPDLDVQAVQATYLKAEPRLVVLDDFLKPEVFEALRAYARRSTFWFEHGPENGYLSISMRDGFLCPLLAQVADELKTALPEILGPHTLKQAWAFKQHERSTGVGLHADAARVNLNFWLSPGESNTDQGGLLIWDKAAPADWSFERFNQMNPESARRFLKDAGASSLHVPYRANRCVVFDSDLFHETHGVPPALDYENRRVNVTLLYGERGDQR